MGATSIGVDITIEPPGAFTPEIVIDPSPFTVAHALALEIEPAEL